MQILPTDRKTDVEYYGLLTLHISLSFSLNIQIEGAVSTNHTTTLSNSVGIW